MRRFAMLTFATNVTALGVVAACSSDMGTGTPFYGSSCTDCAIPDSGANFGFGDDNTSYGDASFSDDSAIDASVDDADAGDEDAD